MRPRPATPAEMAAAPVGRLLVVRQQNQMGDMVCALPALGALRRAYPRARLTFVAAPLCEELLRDHPDIDELLVFRQREMWHPGRLLGFVRRLRRPRPDLAVVMTTVSFSTTSALLAWASGARWRVGASSLPFGSQLSRAIYHLELPLGPEGVHEVEHNLAPLRAMGIAAPLQGPRLEPQPAALARARAFLERQLPGAGGPLLFVHAGAGKRPNVWPPERFASVIEALGRERRARAVLVEGPSAIDAEATAGVHAALGSAAPVWRAPLGDALGMMALADIALCNDTGLAHVAAAVGIPTIVVFGPTDVQRWKPWGDHVRAVCSPTGCIDDIGIEPVLQAVRAGLDMRASAGAAAPAGAPSPARPRFGP